ncbi:MAG: hypothetical protein WCJ45_02850 [bacterium]
MTYLAIRGEKGIPRREHHPRLLQRNSKYKNNYTVVYAQQHDEYNKSPQNINHFLMSHHTHALLLPYLIAHTFLRDTIPHHLFIPIEGRSSAFNFQKDNSLQITF